MKARKARGNANVKPLECVSPVKDKWRVRWDVEPDGEGNASYMEAELEHKPTANKVRALICGWINDQTTEKIRSGFEYDGVPVWLSMENQANYKAAHDLAVQTGGKSLPVTFKLGTDEKPVYKKFETVDELTDFYTKTLRHVQKCLEKGWRKKDAIDWSLYEAG